MGPGSHLTDAPRPDLSPPEVAPSPTPNSESWRRRTLRLPTLLTEPTVWRLLEWPPPPPAAAERRQLYSSQSDSEPLSSELVSTSAHVMPPTAPMHRYTEDSIGQIAHNEGQDLCGTCAKQLPGAT